MDPEKEESNPKYSLFGNILHEINGVYKGKKGLFVINSVAWFGVHFVDMNGKQVT
jgi:hypothetical protein